MPLPFLTPLTADQQRAAGIAEPWPLAMADKVRFSEIDALKHVNNVAYMTWFEALRVRYCALWGISEFSPGEPRLVLRRADVDYLHEINLGEDIIVTARTTEFRNTSFTQAYGIFVHGALRATGSAVVVMLCPDGSGKMPLPDALRARFVDRDGARPA